MPIGYDQQQRPIHLGRADVQVSHVDPRRLLAKVDHPAWTAWLLVLHAPHSGYTLQERHQWWIETQHLLHQYKDSAPLIVMMDANASPGEADGITVFNQGFCTSTSTSLLRTFLHDNHLCLPCTSDCHDGAHGTWRDFARDQWHCIDFIALPTDWKECCTFSQVLEDFDLATSQEDHRATAIQLSWTASYSELRRSNKGRTDDLVDYHAALLQQSLLDHRPVPWEVDIETHLEAFNMNVQKAIGDPALQQRPKHKAKKGYIDDQIWALRHSKLAHRSKMKQLRKHLQQELLIGCFRAWRHHQPPTDEHLCYRHTLLALQIKHWMAFRRDARLLKFQLQTAKQRHLRQALDEMDGTVAAADIIRRLKSFIGPTNPKKLKQKTLPLLQDADGAICTNPADALGTWIDYFMQMEGGNRISYYDLRRQWIKELHTFVQPQLSLDLANIPTLTDLELSYRRVPAGKAVGPDGVPGALCKHQSAALALTSYSQLLKLYCHGQEFLGHKGGQLSPAYKGKGSTLQCSSYRSLLVSSNIGKVLHRTVRQSTADLYEAFLQANQIGGRRKIPVQLAVHGVRAHLRRARHRHRSVGVLFLDLSEAFYRILREISMGGVPSDETIARIMLRLQMPPQALHDIKELLEAPDALSQAGLPPVARNCIASIHSSTHFWLSGQLDVVKTCVGTRPGDSFADVIFGYSWSVVLRKLEHYMIEQNLVDAFPSRAHPPFFESSPVSLATNDYTYIGPTWMDDLALCLEGCTPQQLESRMGHATGHLLDLCRRHLMTPNLAKGKTEMLLIFRGAASRSFKEKHYGLSASGLFPIVGEHGVNHIQIVKMYKHLGGWIHHRTDQRQELSQKIAIAHESYKTHRKLLYGNPQISQPKRVELFTTLVLSKFLYGADTWIFDTKRDFERFHTAVLRLYKRLYGWKPEMQMTDNEIMVALDVPSPEELLCRARLRYLVVLCQCGLSDVWTLISQDRDWCNMIEKDCLWLWRQLRNSSPLQDPREHFSQWYLLLQDHPRYWKRLVNRACQHAVLQRRKNLEVCDLHHRLQTCFCEFFSLPVSTGIETQPCSPPTDASVFGCMHCRLHCKNRAGEGAHMFRAHGHQSRYRRFFDEPSCPACLKFFHTMAKTKAHLYHSKACRDVLMSRNMQCSSTGGTGSLEDHVRVQQHDFLLPPTQGYGPHPQPARPRAMLEMDDGLYLTLVDFIADQRSLCQLEQCLLHYVDEHPISWTRWKATILFFVDAFDSNDAAFFAYDQTDFQRHLWALADAQHWSFLGGTVHHQKVHSTIEENHQRCRHLCSLALDPVQVPRQFGKHRYILHAFSGRRRIGDLQYFLERKIQQQETYILNVISLDIVVDADWGNVAKAETRQFWIRAIRSKWVLAFIGGPPCETWSRVRAVTHDSSTGPQPRVLRDLDNLWGYEQVSIKELIQTITGNCLLGFSLEAILEIAVSGGFGLLEHPAEPCDLPHSASIWRLPILRLLMCLPGVQRCRFSQGLLGAATPKPTELLLVNMEDMIWHLHRRRVCRELPRARAVGKDVNGHWLTSTLKEYPPSLCLAFAEALFSHIDQCPIDAEATPPSPGFVATCSKMICTAFGDTIGHDFARP